MRVSAEKAKPRAAIILRQASGAIISGNHITVEGASPTRHSIYVRDGGKNIRIENNTFMGTSNLVTLLDNSVVQLKNNKIKQ